MKASHASILLIAGLNLTVPICANDEVLDLEFLEFLADMDEATGNGFNRWLEDKSMDEMNSQAQLSNENESDGFNANEN